MGTRNLTMVVHEKKPVIAQYGQWDGYPEGNGVKILTFLRKAKMDKFKEKLKAVRFSTKEDENKVDEFLKSIGCKDGWMNMNQAEKYHKAFPYLSRNIGASILDLVYNSNDKEIVLQDSSDFAGDSLFCEWAYVIDLDKKVLEVYEGFNQRPLGKTQRFKDAAVEKDSQYTPVRCVKKYKLSELPTKKVFLKELKPKEDE